MTDADRAQGALPAEPTRLVGRRAELVRVSALSQRSRLVTVTGVGGVGKTRLALRAAAEARPRYRDGAYWVALSGIDDGAALAFAIAEALPLRDQTIRPMIDVVADYLAGRELLLVLDTCEHLVDVCAITVAALLAASPGLRVLATSRRPLGLDEEATFSLQPFPVIGEDSATGDAVALLADRAASAAPGLESEVTGEQAVRLCRRLDGLPLAIELAAARLAEMPIAELIDRLDDRFALLGDDADAGADAAAEADPPWHQALRTAIGWSHELCSAPERLLWARLSVFAGGFDAEAVVRVCSDDRLPAAKIPGLLAGLAEKSVLIPVPGQPVTRFRMLDTIREYGAFWLRGLGEVPTLRRRHLEHFLEMAREGDADWLGPGQVAWYRRVTTEHDNLRAALDFSLTEPEGVVALELAGALWFMWYPYGFLREGRRYLELALDAAGDRASVAHNRAQWALGLVMISMGDPDGVQRAGELCASGAAAAGDPLASVHASTLQVGAAILRGDLPEVMARAESVLLAAPDEGAISLPVLLASLIRGIALLQSGRAEEAVRALADLRDMCEQAGEHWMRAYGDAFRAQAELVRGDPKAATRYATSAVRAKRWLHDHTGMAICIDVLGTAADALGQSERTARLLGLSQQIWESIGRPQAGVPEWVATREACEARARAALGDAAYEAAFADGYRDVMDDGVDRLLEEPIGLR